MKARDVSAIDRATSTFRTPEFVKNFAALRMCMEEVDDLFPPAEMAEKLGVGESVVLMIFALFDAVEETERLIEATKPIKLKQPTHRSIGDAKWPN